MGGPPHLVDGLLWPNSWHVTLPDLIAWITLNPDASDTLFSDLRCVYTDPRPRPSLRPRPSWKSRWKRTPRKVYGLYWNSGLWWKTRTRVRPSVNTFDEMLRDFKKRTQWRTRTRISVNASLLVRSMRSTRGHIHQSGAAANFGNRTHRQIWGPNVNNNIYILTHEYSSTGFE